MVTMASPLRRGPFARARWLVLAPHADDETLGAGALIATATVPCVVFLTDGGGSHDEGGAWLVRRRQREAGLALRRLTGTKGPRPVFFGWPDAHPHPPASAAYRRSCRSLAMLMRRDRIDAVAVTAAHEPHCDHAAFHHLARGAIVLARRQIALFVYHVWSDPRPSATHAFRTEPMHSGCRRHALLAHRSQTSAAYGAGFRLPRAAWRMPATDTLYLDPTDAR